MNFFPRFLLCLCLCGIVSAQEKPKVELQFISFPKATSPETVELIVGEDEVIEVELPTNELSKVYSVDRMENWTLGKSGSNEKGEQTFNVYGQAKSINARKQLILVIRKGSDASGGFELKPMDNGSSGLSGGSYFFMNASRVDIGGYIGDKKFSLKPGTYDILNPKPSKKRGARMVSFVKIFYRDQESNPTPFFTSEWRYSKTARTLAFVYHNPLGKQLRLHVIRDYNAES